MVVNRCTVLLTAALGTIVAAVAGLRWLVRLADLMDALDREGPTP